MNSSDYAWLITERVTGEYRPASGDFTIRDAVGHSAVLMMIPRGTLYFDGQFIDVGDDLMDYLQMLDDIQENEFSEPYRGEGSEQKPEPGRHPDAYEYGESWGPDNPAPGSTWSGHA